MIFWTEELHPPSRKSTPAKLSPEKEKKSFFGRSSNESPENRPTGSPQRLLGSLAASQVLPKCEMGVHRGGRRGGGGRGSRLCEVSPILEQQQEGYEEQAPKPDVYEPVQVHFWREQGARRDCHDSSGADQHEDA